MKEMSQEEFDKFYKAHRIEMMKASSNRWEPALRDTLFQGLDFSKKLLCKIDFSGSVFVDVKARGANFHLCNMENTTWQNCDTREVKITCTKWKGSSLDESSVAHLDFAKTEGFPGSE